MRLKELSKIFSTTFISNKKQYTINLLFLLALIAGMLCISCEESLPGLINPDTLDTQRIEIKDGAIEWRSSPVNIGEDDLLYIGEDQSVKTVALAQFEDTTFIDMDPDSIININLVLHTYRQLFQERDDSVDAKINISQINQTEPFESEGENLTIDDINSINKVDLKNYTIPDTMTSSQKIEISIAVEKLSGQLTSENKLNLLFEASDAESDFIQSIHSSNYSTQYLQLEVEYQEDGDTTTVGISADKDASMIEYKNKNIANDSVVVTEGFESYLILPVTIDTNFAQTTIVTKAELTIDYEDVIDYGTGVPLSFVNTYEAGGDFSLSQVDTLDANRKYVYSDSSTSSFTFNVKNLVQNAVAEGENEFYLVIWCDNAAADVTQFIIDEKKYNLEILIANQEIKN